MATTYSFSTEAQQLGKALIKKHHSDLARTNFMYVFQERIDGESGQSIDILKNGKPVLSKLVIIRGLNAFIVGGESTGEGEAFFVIVISKCFWNRMTPLQKNATIDQRLCEATVGDEGVLSRSDYDVAEFNVIAKRYGAWNEDLHSFLEVTSQLKLDLESTPSLAAPPKEETEESEAEGKAASKSRRSTKLAAVTSAPTSA